MGKFHNTTGKRFGMLVILEDNRGQGANPRLRCRCDCGIVTRAAKARVLSGEQWHCGCRYFVPGGHLTTLYRIYKRLRKAGKLHPAWHDYRIMLRDTGGITDRAVRPIDYNAPIGPKNWEFGKIGGRMRLVTWRGQARTMAGWARQLGVSRERVRQLHNTGKLIDRLNRK
jgi:hypothetical protein